MSEEQGRGGGCPQSAGGRSQQRAAVLLQAAAASKISRPRQTDSVVCAAQRSIAFTSHALHLAHGSLVLTTHVITLHGETRSSHRARRTRQSVAASTAQRHCQRRSLALVVSVRDIESECRPTSSPRSASCTASFALPPLSPLCLPPSASLPLSCAPRPPLHSPVSTGHRLPPPSMLGVMPLPSPCLVAAFPSSLRLSLPSSRRLPA